MEMLVFQLVMMIIFGAIASAIASSKGRTPIGWFFGGFFIGLIGIIIVAVLPNLKEQKYKEEAIERENRRLREQLMQEQIKTEAFRQHAAARLDAHDVHLGVDTRQAVTALPSPGNPAALTGPDMDGIPNLASDSWPNQAASNDPFSAPLVAATTPLSTQQAGNVGSGYPADAAMAASVGQRQWYYEVQGKAQGPISDSDLVRLAQQGIIVDSTLVWTQQLGNWKSAGTIKSLKQFLKF
jgi:type II secretory pathway pseudopilin PulG